MMSFNCKYFSVCSGIEAASVAWNHLGWEPVGFSEIDPFPCAILAHHYPQVKNYGDMTQCHAWEISSKIDILVGGTPCQSFSFAGKRTGMDDLRGQLAIKFFDIVKKYRPRWIVWENVPGVLSSNKGKDFGLFLSNMSKYGYGFAYRILDAQYFGVPQRRRRVFVVGYLGDWRCAAAVLFEKKNLHTKLKQDIKIQNLPNSISLQDVRDVQKKQNGCGWNDSGIAYTVDTHATQGVVYKKNDFYIVRRISPLEYERLQGFPDNYTKIKWKNYKMEECPDDKRFKALGNSMAVPVMRWIGNRIDCVQKLLDQIT